MSKRILFLMAAVVLAGAGLFFRASSAHVAKAQADELIQLDAKATPPPTKIADLKTFTGNHMGASVGFTLQGSYDRAQAAARAAATSTNANSQIYIDAQKACAGKSNSVTQARCNHDYLSSHLANVPTPTPVPAPKLADYQYQFKSPLWTPDLAGALLLGAAIALVASLPFSRLRKVRR